MVRRLGSIGGNFSRRLVSKVCKCGTQADGQITDRICFGGRWGIEFVKDEKGVVGHIAAAGGTLDLKRMVVGADILAKYVGTYPISAGHNQITSDGGALFYQFTGQPRFPMFAESTTNFFSYDGSGTIEFGFEKRPSLFGGQPGADELKAARQQP